MEGLGAGANDAELKTKREQPFAAVPASFVLNREMKTPLDVTRRVRERLALQRDDRTTVPRSRFGLFSQRAVRPRSSLCAGPKQSAKNSGETSAQRAKRWRERFAADSDSPEVIRQTVDDLIAHRQYEEVIACLEQAIIQAKMQPWMYQVLAIAMEAAGRPKPQIERVLLSSQDVISLDAESMMVLAAYLTKFERYERAIELYRQASHLAPHRPEPFLQALSLARKTRNAEAIVWAAPEVRAYAWGSDRAALSREAEQAAADAIPQLTKAGQIAKALALQEGMCTAREIDLHVRLDWSGQGDLDLFVVEPSGSTCSREKPYTVSGGIFVHDGSGPNQARCYDEYVCPRAMSGEYLLRVRHVLGEIVGKRAQLTITRGKDSPHEQTETQTVLLGRTDQTVRISLTQGRRTDGTAPAQVPQKKAARRSTAGSAILSQLNNNPAAQIGGGGGGNVGGIGGQNFGAGGGNVGFQPVVALISEGVSLTAMAAVSGDRRYVRISASPVFSNITDVFTFSFVTGR